MIKKLTDRITQILSTKRDAFPTLGDALYLPPALSRAEKDAMPALMLRCFATDDGRKVLAFLQHMTLYRVLGPQGEGDNLRYLEGQRAVVAMILRMIEQARQ